MRKLLFIIAVFVVGSTGLANAASTTATISNTGPSSTNEIHISGTTGKWSFSISNSNDINAGISLDQDARTGDAEANKNTSGGDATTGDATNEADVEATISIDNSSDACGGCYGDGGGDVEATIDTTGPQSSNTIVIGDGGCGGCGDGYDVDNDNDVDLDVKTKQQAQSGDASANMNTSGGDAETGDANNDSNTDVNVTIDNGNDYGCDTCGGSNDVEATISTTGYASDNVIHVGNSNDCRCDDGNGVNNANDVNLNTEVQQSASSGSANANMNTSGGSATTGTASNSSSTSVSVSINN